MTILALVIVKIYASKERGHFPPPPLSSRTKFLKNPVGVKLKPNQELGIF